MGNCDSESLGTGMRMEVSGDEPEGQAEEGATQDSTSVVESLETAEDSSEPREYGLELLGPDAVIEARVEDEIEVTPVSDGPWSVDPVPLDVRDTRLLVGFDAGGEGAGSEGLTGGDSDDSCRGEDKRVGPKTGVFDGVFQG